MNEQLKSLYKPVETDFLNSINQILIFGIYRVMNLRKTQIEEF